ncbi:DinB family protein [Arenibacter sp. GZD96]|uniref:DinB family protein n=1 Tax=Aurantibrevibacter litoralis TaxID=3106030 RepID=UPI002AFFE161|nr:DinB family protein [Arenibacter sp. GZD-96]MEA1786553.1 DinB family protein [Arenibacter sp. GZD-96]
MKRIVLLVGIGLAALSCSDKNDAQITNVKSILVQQLKNTHTNQDWFVPTKIAIEGLTFDQANWKDSAENHSIGELVSHLVFWNEMNLKAFKGEKTTEVTIDNKETFAMNSTKEWISAVEKLDSIQNEWEQLTQKASNQKLLDWSTEIANMTAHTAYHTGQIMYIRKRNGWWK